MYTRVYTSEWYSCRRKMNDANKFYLKQHILAAKRSAIPGYYQETRVDFEEQHKLIFVKKSN